MNNKLLEKLNYFVYDSEASYFDLDKGEAKLIVEKLNEKQDILKMYDLVFENEVRDYIEDMEEEDKINLSEEEIKEIAHKLIYKNEYIWEIIHETIDNYIGNILNEREENDNE